MRSTSQAEQYLFKKLKEHYEKKYKVSNRDRIIIAPLEIDIVIRGKNLNLAIEYNGAVHSKMIYGKTLKTKAKKFIAIKRRDLIKEGKLKTLGWKFIVIKDDGAFDKVFMDNTFQQIIEIIEKLELKKISFDKFVIEKEIKNR